MTLEEQVLSELAYEVGERYFAIQRTEEGYDSSFYDEDFSLMDGGVYENDEISIEEAAEELLEDEGWKMCIRDRCMRMEITWII